MLKSYYTEFFTATILNWQKLLHDDNLKQIIVDSLQWLVKEKRCTVYAFVIMPNHMHLLWRIAEGLEREMVQGALLSFTAHAFKKHLRQQTANLPPRRNLTFTKRFMNILVLINSRATRKRSLRICLRVTTLLLSNLPVAVKVCVINCRHWLARGLQLLFLLSLR